MAKSKKQEVTAEPPAGWPVPGQDDALSDKVSEMTVEELDEEARKLDIDGRSKMNKGELQAAVRRARNH